MTAVTLTPRQQAVLRLVAQGRTNQEIARALGISEQTGKNYLVKIFARLGVQCRVQAAVWWVTEGNSQPARAGRQRQGRRR